MNKNTFFLSFLTLLLPKQSAQQNVRTNIIQSNEEKIFRKTECKQRKRYSLQVLRLSMMSTLYVSVVVNWSAITTLLLHLNTDR